MTVVLEQGGCAAIRDDFGKDPVCFLNAKNLRRVFFSVDAHREPIDLCSRLQLHVAVTTDHLAAMGILKGAFVAFGRNAIHDVDANMVKPDLNWLRSMDEASLHRRSKEEGESRERKNDQLQRHR